MTSRSVVTKQGVFVMYGDKTRAISFIIIIIIIIIIIYTFV